MARPATPLLFALNATHELGQAVARYLNAPLAEHEQRDFEDGEHKSRPLVSVRDRDVYVLQSLHGDPSASPNDKLCRLLFFVGALKDAGAARVTVVAPYLCYARKDRKTKTRDPVTSRYVAQLFEAVGCDRVVTLDVHNLAAFQNAFRCRTEHLEARGLFIEYFKTLVGPAEVAVVSPDEGGVHRADSFRRAFARALGRPVESGFMEKRRSAGVVSGERMVGEMRGRTAIIVDDLISTGGTLVRAARACRERGANRVVAAASHGLFVGDAGKVLADSAIDRVVVTNSVPAFRVAGTPAAGKLVVLDVAPLLGECIKRLHEGGSVVELYDLPE
ncbi:MAG TPA: ribose-phosphate pyrophosphokinase [Alphaproteobacteria bacterium]